MMTPCDGTANSTRWCCGDNVECCAGDIGVETLAQTFTGMLPTATLTPILSTTALTSSLITTTSPSGSDTAAPADSKNSSTISAGAIAGIVIGAVVAMALMVAVWFFFAYLRRPAVYAPPTYVEEGHSATPPKASYPHEADASGSQVSEVPAADAKNHNGRERVYEM